ncbi:MAG: L-fucose/L-arabinose isomerase family protein [Bacillota bacterium]
MRIGLVTLAWDGNFDFQFALDKMTATRALLARHGEVVGPERPISSRSEGQQAAKLLEEAHIDCLILQQGTFCAADPLPAIVERLPVPIAIWAVREPFDGGRLVANSLCGIQLMASVLTRLGRPYRYFYGNPDEPACTQAVENFVRAAAAVSRLRTMRIGLAGSRAPGFYPLAVDELALRAQVGPEIVHVDLSEILGGPEPAAGETTKARSELERSVTNAAAAPVEQLDKVSRAVARSREVVQRQGLDALAVKCWPEFLNNYGVAACPIVSRLATDGVAAGCEGDVNGAVTSALLQELTDGGLTFAADLIKVDPTDNTAILWHCGAAPVELAATDATVKFGFEFSGVGMNLEFTLKPGRVTVARLGFRDGRYRLLVARGESLPTPLLARGTMALVRFDASAQKLLDTIVLDGWEHHFSLVYGDVAGVLVEVAALLGLEYVLL